MKVLIYGGGSVGLGIASSLLKAGKTVDIIAREKTVSALSKKGLVRSGIFGSFNISPSRFGSYASLNELFEKCYDYVLVCTKSFDSFEAANDLSKHTLLFGDKTKVVLFQNGWGNAEKFLPFFKEQMIFSARVITGFERPKYNEVHITVHADSIHIGSLFSADISCAEDLAESIAEGGIPCEITENIEKDLWAKMLYNCALNGLGAILDVPYGVLAKYEFTRNIMNNIVEETFTVMKPAGYKTHWEFAKDFLEVFYSELVPDTAEHKSSTLQDIAAKKETEIDALNGAVIELGEKFGVETPYNSTVYNIIKFIEAMNLRTSE